MQYSVRLVSIVTGIVVLFAGYCLSLSADEPVPANPLQNLLQKVFQAKQAPTRPAVEKPADGKKKAPTKKTDPKDLRDEIDARLPISRELTGPISELETLIQQQKWEKALNNLQELTEFTIINHKFLMKEDSFHRNAQGQLISTRAAFLELLKQFPQEYRDRFSENNQLQAEQLLKDAQKSNQLSDDALLANWFFHTPAGHQAVDYLGTVHMDRGEFAMAAYRFESLFAANAPLTESIRWKTKAALAYQLTGQADKAKAMILQIQPEQTDLTSRKTRELHAIVKNSISAKQPLLKEYWQHNDSTVRTGASAYTQPLLLPRWRVPITEHQPIIETIGMLNADLKNSSRALIPASVPITVKGKVIFRTLNGIRIVDQSSGETLWQTQVDISAEEILSLGPQQYQYYPYNYSSSQSADYHPLTSLLYRDLVYGTLSSDGERLFALENLAVLSNANPGSYTYSSRPNDPYRRNWDTNKITAYDIDSGRPLWEIGDAENNEVFDLPLAGHFFFGVPVVGGNNLYVIGEKEREIRLHVLNRTTGRPIWSQLLAYADISIDRDIGRRWWSAQANVQSGVIVCPTTLGWLVAIDSVNHRLLWAQRYTQPQKQNSTRRSRRTNVAVQRSILNTRWSHPAPIIANNRVIFTPPENDQLFCFDLQTGKKVWKIAKNSSEKLFVAGVIGDKVLCINKESMSAFSLANGNQFWIHNFIKKNGVPAGKGLSLVKHNRNQLETQSASQNLATHYLLPMSSKKLILVDLENGRVTENYQYDKPLGNLTLHHGRICSLSSTEITCFEDLDQLRTEIGQLKQKNPSDPWAHWREARIQQKQGDLRRALEIVRGIQTESAAPQLVSRIRASHLDMLSEMIRNDSADHTKEIEELNKLAESPTERLRAKLLIAGHLLKQRKYDAALEIYWNLSDWSPTMLPRLDSERVTVRLDNWLAAQIQHVWQTMPLEERSFMDERISSWASKIKSEDIQAQRKFLKLFSFHPESIAIQNSLISYYQSTGALSTAEQELQQLLTKNNAESEITSLAILAEICRKYDFKQDALYYLRALQLLSPDQKLNSGESIENAITELMASAEDNRTSTDWQQGVHIEHFGTSNSNQLFSINASNSNLPFYRDHDFKLDYNQQRLIIRNINDGSLFWSVPLRNHNRARSSNDVALKPIGLHLLVYYRGYIQCLSLLDKKILWSMPSDYKLSSHVYTSYRSYRGSSRNTAYPAMESSRNTSYYAFNKARQSGALCAANEYYVCVRGTCSLAVHDTLSGELLWKHESIPQNSQVLCTNTIVFVKSSNNNVSAYRFLDGKQLALADARESLQRAIATVDDNLITINTSQVQSVNPLTNQPTWTYKLPGSTVYWQLVNSSQLITILPDGKIRQIDLNSGEVHEVGQIPQNLYNNKRQLFAIADNGRMYVIVNNSTSGDFYQEQLPSIRIRGYLLAFDLSEQKLLWQQKVSEQYLVVEQFANMPILLFVTRKGKRIKNSSYWGVHLLVKDKQTGKTWYDGLGSINNGYNRLQVNLADQYIALRSYSQAIRIRAVGRQAASINSNKSPKPGSNNTPKNKLPAVIRTIIEEPAASAPSEQDVVPLKPKPEGKLQKIIDNISLKK